MNVVAPAIVYALFVWWFSTGLVLLLVLRRRAIVRAGLVGAALLLPVCLYVLAKSSARTDVWGAYVAFTAAILLWGTQEIAFLAGILTGPRPLPCPAGATGVTRVRYAVMSILYHEVALAACGLAVFAVDRGGPNQVGTLTFAVLWVMRISAKLNLFLGVPVLNDGFMPAPIAYARSYFRRGPVNAFMPVAMGAAVLATDAIVAAALDPAAGPAGEAGGILVASLLVLAIVEHVFMVVPLPIERLWAWSTRRWSVRRSSASRWSARRSGVRQSGVRPGGREGLSAGEWGARSIKGDIKRAAPTRP